MWFVRDLGWGANVVFLFRGCYSQTSKAHMDQEQKLIFDCIHILFFDSVTDQLLELMGCHLNRGYDIKNSKPQELVDPHLFYSGNRTHACRSRSTKASEPSLQMMVIWQWHAREWHFEPWCLCCV